MRVERIIFRNFRQLRAVEFLFPHSQHDLHLFVAQNGTAKTNIINGINWCLYGDEPHISRGSEKLPLLNMNCLEEASDNKNEITIVELYISVDDEYNIIFKRIQKFIIKKDIQGRNKPYENGQEFNVIMQRRNSTPEILLNDEAVNNVERFIPHKIRDFYFFDGEKLDSYFRETTGNRIKETMNKISGIDLLKTILNRLQTFLLDITRDIAKANPKADNTSQQILFKSNLLKEEEVARDNYQEQIRVAKQRLSDIEEFLKDSPDVISLEDNRNQFKKQKIQITNKINKAVKDKNELLYRVGRLVLLKDVILDVNELIKNKKKNNELPPRIDRDLIEDSLKTKMCKISNQDLPPICITEFKKIIEKFELSTNVASQLTEMGPVLNQFENEIKKFPDLMKELTVSIVDLEADLKKSDDSIAEIDNLLSNYQTDKIRNLAEERMELEKAKDSSIGRLAIEVESIKNLKNDIEILNSKLNNELDKIELNKSRLAEKELIDRTVRYLENIIDSLSLKIKQKVQERTNELFFSLIWKKGTYNKVIINDEYNVELFHSSGFSSLGSASAAERELLALSFILALHNISGFDAPLFIDTPVARVAGENRINMGKVLGNISLGKQVTLLFTPDEYSENIQRELSHLTKNKHSLKLISNEHEVKLEDL